MLQSNPPDHTRLRRLVSRAFTPARVRELAARVEALTPSLLSGDPPVQLISRFALRSAEVAGSTIAAGSFVVMLLGAANRDPAPCANPGHFSVRRAVARHLAFGQGIHFCLGAPLARLEAAIALRPLRPLLPRLRVSGEPEWKPNTVLRGLEHRWLEQAPLDGAGAGVR
jgi:cytochrome P450